MKHRRRLAIRRKRYASRKQRGGNIPQRYDVVITAPPGGDANSNDPDSVATPQSFAAFEENSTADPEKSV